VGAVLGPGMRWVTETTEAMSCKRSVVAQDGPLGGVVEVSRPEGCTLGRQPGRAGSAKGVRSGDGTGEGGTALNTGGAGRGKGTRPAGWAV